MKQKFLSVLIFILFTNLFFFHQFGLFALALLILALWFLLVQIFATTSTTTTTSSNLVNSTHAQNTKIIKRLGTASIFIIVTLLTLLSAPEKIFLLVVLAIEVMAVSVYALSKQAELSGLLELALAGLISIREYLAGVWKMLGGTWVNSFKESLKTTQKQQKEKSSWAKSIVLGLLAGLPLVAWLISILSKADPIFAKFVREILSEKLLAELPSRLIFSFLLLLLLAPFLLMKFKKYTSPLAWLDRVKWDREVAVVTIMVSLVLGTFLAVQWPYVFAQVALETDLSNFGVATYSEYVQKGFGDLLKVVLIVFATAWAGALIHKSQKTTERKVLSIAQAVLGLEFVVFIISIFRRVWLYQNSHGLSLARLYGLAILILISGLAVTLTLRYFYKQVKWVRVEALWVILITLAVIIGNMEGLIVKNPPTVNGRIDHVYLSRLPADGYQGWLQAYQWANDFLSKKSAESGLIDKESRRDLYYAQLIVEELSGNFHDLIKDYGSDEEIRAYFLAEIAKEKNMVEKYLVFGDDQDTREEKDRQLKELDEVMTAMDQEDWREKVEIGNNRHQSNRGYGQAYLKPESLPKEYFGTTGRLDRIFNWNYTRYRAYQQLKTEIGFANIARLQDEFLSLDRKVSSQPSEERSYEIDISLQSPFLQ